MLVLFLKIITNYIVFSKNINSVYGHSINISEIKKLTLNDYEEKLIKQITPEFYQNVFATHHLSSIKDFSIIDGCFSHYK